MTPDRIVKAAAAALEDIKGHDIVAFDVRKLTSLFDRMVIASGDSSRQVNALSRSVQDKLKAAGVRVFGVEGEANGEWVLVDLGPVLVHIMQPAIRQYYNLEELWGSAPQKKFGEGGAQPAARRAARATPVPAAPRKRRPAKTSKTSR